MSDLHEYNFKVKKFMVSYWEWKSNSKINIWHVKCGPFYSKLCHKKLWKYLTWRRNTKICKNWDAKTSLEDALAFKKNWDAKTSLEDALAFDG